MPWLADLLTHQMLIFVLALARVGGLMLVAPVLGAREAPLQVRGLLTVAIALLLVPSQLAQASPPPPASLVELSLIVAEELLIGLALGMGALLLFTGLHLAGQIIAQASGMALAEVFNPTAETSVPVFSEFLYVLGLGIFLLLDGQRLVLDGLLGTLESLPLGQTHASLPVAEALLRLVSESFEIAVRVAAPTTLALLLATLVLGLISRTLPQLNVLALGFGLNALATMGVMALSLAGMALVLEDRLEPILRQVLDALQSTAPMAGGSSPS
jgi:flagellar biosynthesis protein FliR